MINIADFKDFEKISVDGDIRCYATTKDIDRAVSYFKDFSSLSLYDKWGEQAAAINATIVGITIGVQINETTGKLIDYTYAVTLELIDGSVTDYDITTVPEINLEDIKALAKACGVEESIIANIA